MRPTRSRFVRECREKSRTCSSSTRPVSRNGVARKFQAATKAVMRMIGLDCGPARLPLRNLGEADTAALRTYTKLGFTLWDADVQYAR